MKKSLQIITPRIIYHKENNQIRIFYILWGNLKYHSPFFNIKDFWEFLDSFEWVFCCRNTRGRSCLQLPIYIVTKGIATLTNLFVLYLTFVVEIKLFIVSLTAWCFNSKLRLNMENIYTTFCIYIFQNNNEILHWIFQELILIMLLQ